MEGKAILFKEFGGIDAWPVCLATKDADEIVRTVAAHRAGLRRHQPRGHRRAALLRDRGAPARGARHPGLPRRPARHGDRRPRGPAERAPRRRQAARGRPRRPHRRRRGRAPPRRACSLAAGAGEVVCCDRRGMLYPRPPGPRRVQGRARRARRIRAGCGAPPTSALAGADVYIGLSGPGAVSVEGIRSMADGAIVFAMANPTPEIAPEEIERRRRRHRHRPLRLPEPDQQRARLPRCLPRRARRPGDRRSRARWSSPPPMRSPPSSSPSTSSPTT